MGSQSPKKVYQTQQFFPEVPVVETANHDYSKQSLQAVAVPKCPTVLGDVVNTKPNPQPGAKKHSIFEVRKQRIKRAKDSKENIVSALEMGSVWDIPTDKSDILEHELMREKGKTAPVVTLRESGGLPKPGKLERML